MKVRIKKNWNTHTGIRRYFSIDGCIDQCWEGVHWYYIGITLFGLTIVAFDV